MHRSPEPHDPSQHDGQRQLRRFRAATMEQALDAARAELGPSVEIVEANRIRRGGVGGFFATDLGIELTVAVGSGDTGPGSVADAPTEPTLDRPVDYQYDRRVDYQTDRPVDYHNDRPVGYQNDRQHHEADHVDGQSAAAADDEFVDPVLGTVHRTSGTGHHIGTPQRPNRPAAFDTFERTSAILRHSASTQARSGPADDPTGEPHHPAGDRADVDHQAPLRTNASAGDHSDGASHGDDLMSRDLSEFERIIARIGQHDDDVATADPGTGPSGDDRTNVTGRGGIAPGATVDVDSRPQAGAEDFPIINTAAPDIDEVTPPPVTGRTNARMDEPTGPMREGPNPADLFDAGATSVWPYDDSAGGLHDHPGGLHDHPDGLHDHPDGLHDHPGGLHDRAARSPALEPWYIDRVDASDGVTWRDDPAPVNGHASGRGAGQPPDAPSSAAHTSPAMHADQAASDAARRADDEAAEWLERTLSGLRDGTATADAVLDGLHQPAVRPTASPHTRLPARPEHERQSPSAEPTASAITPARQHPVQQPAAHERPAHPELAERPLAERPLAERPSTDVRTPPEHPTPAGLRPHGQAPAHPTAPLPEAAPTTDTGATMNYAVGLTKNAAGGLLAQLASMEAAGTSPMADIKALSVSVTMPDGAVVDFTAKLDRTQHAPTGDDPHPIERRG